jgi:PAS domain S-box-containing protein
MYDDKLPQNASPGSGLEHTSPLNTLSDAVIFLDQAATILSANERAAAIVGKERHELPGHTLWQAAPQIVTTTSYQAVVNATRTHASFQVEYRSPITQTWFHMYLSPTSEGIALFFHEEAEPVALPDSTLQRHGGYLDILENSSERIAILTPEGLLLEINQQPLTDAHVRREEVVGQPFIQSPWWSAVPASQEQLRAAIVQASKGDTVRFEAEIRPQAEWSLDLAVTLTPHFDGNQQVEYLIYTSRDITERKHAEEELRALVDAIPQLIWIARPDGYMTYNNRRLSDYIAMTLEQVEGDGWMARVHPDDRQWVQDAWQTSIQTGVPYEVEHRLQNGSSGAYRWFLVRGVPQKNAQGMVQSWIGAATDIDEQKQAEERIKASEQNFRVLAETVPHLVWTSPPHGGLDYTNQRYLDWTQTDFEHLKGFGWRQFVHPDDRERTVFLRQRSLETGELYESEYRLRNSQTGEYRWVLARAYPVHNEDGQIIRWFGTSTDINEQKRTEEALRQSQAQVQALMASNIIGIFIAESGGKGVIIEANETFLRMTGYSQEDLQQRRVNRLNITAPEYAAITEHVHEQLNLHEYVAPFEKEYIGKDGSHLPVLVGCIVSQLDPPQEICFVLDNSARKALEQRKDTFISMAGHELRTPLTALKMQIQLLRRRLEKQGQQQAVTTFPKVEEPIRQLERLIGELLDVSKMQAGKLEYIQESVDLSALLHEVAETMQQIHTTHTIVVHDMEHLTVVGDKDRLEQVVINLLSNAIKYSPDAKTVEIALSATPETATITVCDYGEGIPQEQREKIFERFYRVASSSSKKGMIPGLGMGLYIVEEIVKQHKGTIMVESTLGKGSTFRVTLPLKKEI